MLITNNRFNIYSNYNSAKRNDINFRGHAGCDFIRHNGKPIRLTTETAFFRDYKTLEYAVNYVNKVFKNVKEKKFLVGGCSSGEEVWSLKMLMGNNPVKITGFDLSPKQIETARKGYYEIKAPTGEKETQIIDKYGASAYKDYYLGAQDISLTENEKALKQMFDKTFESINSKERIIYGLKEKLRKIFDIGFIEFEKTPFKLRNPKQKDCNFVVGDIRELKDVNGNNKNQLFSFRNALYHITSNNNDIFRSPYEPEKVEPELNAIFKSVNKALCNKGIFIMGEKEYEQGVNLELIYKTLINNGFIPVRTKINQPYYNIWIKNRDIG